MPCSATIEYGLKEWGAGGTAGQDAASGSARGRLRAPGASQAATQHQPARCEGSAARPEPPAAAEGRAVHAEEAPAAEGAGADPTEEGPVSGPKRAPPAECGTWLAAIYRVLKDLQPRRWLMCQEIARCV